MDLRSHYPYGLLRHGIVNSYPSLDHNINTDVTVMGAGISGALVAWQLIKAGYRVTVVDKRHAGTGSTAASTSLLQYEIDIPLHKLIGKIGERKAVRSYLLCRDAIYKLREICREMHCSELFTPKPSFQFASAGKHVKSLETEFSLRRKAGFDMEWFTARDVIDHYGFNKPAGLLSADGAEADAYLITHRLLETFLSAGGKLFDHTEVKEISHQKKKIKLTTGGNHKIYTRFLVIACGYESQKFLPKKVERMHSTFAIASEPFVENVFWYQNSLIWETSFPYLYLRTTKDNRILVGGKDLDSSNPVLRDRLLPSRARALESSFKKLFPGLAFKTDFKWAGVFADSKDGLPLIGAVRGQPGIFYTIGFGGNGTTFSVVAAELIRDQLRGKKNPDAEIFSFERL